MDDMAINDGDKDNLWMTIHNGTEDATYQMNAVYSNNTVTAAKISNGTISGSYPPVGAWGSGTIQLPPSTEMEITHVVEEEEGLVGYTEDGTRVILGDWVPTAVSLRVRSLLERIAAGEDLSDSDLEKFVYLKRLLVLQEEELDLCRNRIEFIEELIAL